MLNNKLLSIETWGLDIESFVRDTAHKMSAEDLVENILALAKQLTDEADFTQSSRYPKHKGYNKGRAIYISELFQIKSWVLRGLLQKSRERGMRVIGDADDKFSDIIPSNNKEELRKIATEYHEKLSQSRGSIKLDASKGYTHLVIISYSTVRYMTIDDYRDYVIFIRTRNKLMDLREPDAFVFSKYKDSLPSDISALKELRRKLTIQLKCFPRSATRVSPYEYGFTRLTPHGKETFYIDAKCIETHRKLEAIRMKMKDLQDRDRVSEGKIRLDVEKYISDKFIFNFAKLNGYTYGAVKVPYQVLANYCSQVIIKSNRHIIVIDICNEFLKSVMSEINNNNKISTKTGISFSRISRHFLYTKDRYILNECESNGVKCSTLHKLDSDYYANKASKLLREYRNWLDNIERGCY